MQRLLAWLKRPMNMLILAGSLAPMLLVHLFIQRFKANIPRVDHG